MTSPPTETVALIACQQCGVDFAVPDPANQPDLFTGMCPRCGTIAAYGKPKLRFIQSPKR